MKPLLSINFHVGLCVHVYVTIAGHLGHIHSPVINIVRVQRSTCNNNLTSTQPDVLACRTSSGSILEYSNI